MKKTNEPNKNHTSGSGKMVPMSTRISQRDAEFLSTLNIQNATTPSEKLREVISQARKQHESTQDYRSSLLLYQEMLNRVASMVREVELEHDIHSELVSRLTEWLPDMMAYVTSMGNTLQQSADVAQLTKFEDGITDRSFRLINSILQMGLTDICACYEEQAVSKRMDSVIKLVNVLQK